MELSIPTNGGPLVVQRLPVPFLRQLEREGRSTADLALIRSTLDLARSMYLGAVDFDGGPFICHGIGTASVCSQLGMPIDYVAFAMIHNLYGSDAFGDGAGSSDQASRRELVRVHLGPTVESHVHDRWRNRSSLITFAFDSDSQHAVSMRLVEYADLYEKWENGRIWAALPTRADREFVAANRQKLIAEAEELYGKGFARLMEAALSHDDDLPNVAKTGMQYSTKNVPNYAVHRSVLDEESARASLSRLGRNTFMKGRRTGGRVYRKSRRFLAARA